MATPLIYYCDDEQEFIDRFSRRHPHYDVKGFNRVNDLLDYLPQGKSLPDLILLDLYHPKNTQAPDYEILKKEAQEALDQISNDLAEVKLTVEKIRDPAGVEALENIKKMKSPIRDIPVAIYTRRGLLILDDKNIRTVAENGGLWVIKNSKHGQEQISDTTERVWIDSIMSRQQSSKSDNIESLSPKINVANFIKSLTFGSVLLLLTLFGGAYSLGYWTAEMTSAASSGTE